MANNIENSKKAIRILSGRRFTHAHLNDFDEAFGKPIDIGAEEVYTQVAEIPNTTALLNGQTFNSATQDGTYFTSSSPSAVLLFRS